MWFSIEDKNLVTFVVSTKDRELWGSLLWFPCCLVVKHMLCSHMLCSHMPCSHMPCSHMPCSHMPCSGSSGLEGCGDKPHREEERIKKKKNCG